MAWVINISIDPDKANVGVATAVFTDDDGSTFTASGRALLTASNANAFVAQANTARNTWRTRKTSEANARTTMVNSFTSSGEQASATTDLNDHSVVINL